MVAQSVAEILSDHVSLSVEGIDRMYLNVYVPTLQRDDGILAPPRLSRVEGVVVGEEPCPCVPFDGPTADRARHADLWLESPAVVAEIDEFVRVVLP